ncbi:RNA polymerase sigma factor [Streptomyces violascens]|uniref:RNA polymerase sigma factor n=1 Tax=Streptomyces violascens TaxID=67381 RepID=UPI0036518425
MAEPPVTRRQHEKDIPRVMKKIFGAKVPHQPSRPEVLGALDSEDGLPRESLEQWAYVIVHENNLRAYAAKVVGRADGPGPRIVFNGALLKVHRALKKGPVDNVRTFFMRVLRNEAIDYWRQLARQRLREVSVGDDTAFPEQPDVLGELDTDERAQMKQYYERLRAELTDNELEAFFLMEFERLSAQEVSAVMSDRTDNEMTPNNVRQTVWRARKKLRAHDALARLGLAVAE